MEIEFSAIGTGLCPSCQKCNNCPIQYTLKEAAMDFRDAQGCGMEMVIYDCPEYVPSEEKASINNTTCSTH